MDKSEINGDKNSGCQVIRMRNVSSDLLKNLEDTFALVRIDYK